MRLFSLHIPTTVESLVAILAIASLIIPAVGQAAPPYSPYMPGETIAPECAPGDTHCTVSTSTPYYDPVTHTIHVDNTIVDNATTTTLWIGALTGVLRAMSGQVVTGLVDLVADVIGVLPIVNGGTGTSTAPLAGQLLMGNSSGSYDLIDASSLGFLHDGDNVSFQNATTTNLTITGTLALDLIDGCLEISNGTVTSTGSNCGIGGGGISNLNGLTGSSQSFVTATASGLTLSVISLGGVHTFTPGLAAGYEVPLTASTTIWNNASTLVSASSTFWDQAYASTTALTPGYIRSLFTAGMGLSYVNGQFALTAGLSDLSDVTLSGSQPGQLLAYNGTEWVNLATSSLGLPTSGDTHDPVTVTGENYITLSGQQITARPVDLSGSNATGTLASARLSGTYSNLLSFSNPNNVLSGLGSGLTGLNASNISAGVLAVPFGGTGLSTYAIGDLLYASGSTTLARRSIGSVGNVLSVSAAGLPEWTATSSLGIAFTDIQGSASQLQIPLDLEISGGQIEATPIGLTIPSVALFTGITAGNATTTNAVTDILVVHATATTPVLDVTSALRLGSGSGLLRAVGGLISSVGSGAVNLVSDVSGVLAPSHGGTGLVNIEAGALLFGNGAGGIATTSPGVGGRVLAYVGGLPTWVATTTFSGALAYANGNVSIGTGAIGNDLLANSAVTVTAGAGLSGGGSTTLGGTATLTLNTGNVNHWTGLQTFVNASTSLLTVTGTSTFGGSSFDATGKLTLANIGLGTLLAVNASGAVVSSSTPTLSALITSSTTATSTLAGGLAIGGNKLVVDRVTGNVGIGGTLSVTGKVAAALGFSGTCHSDSLGTIDILAIVNVLNALGCNQDLAEVYATYELTQVGDVVAIPAPEDQAFDENGMVLVGKTRGQEDEQVLGVVSMNPGLVFNNGRTSLAGANDALVTPTSTVVALAGRVPVRVATDNGPIRAGDKLARSKTMPGVVVRAIEPGMVVGTALQSYTGADVSMVMMFVDLQWYPGQAEGAFDRFTNAVAWSLSKLGLAFVDGVVLLRDLKVERMTTDQLCLDDVCISKEQLRQMLDRSMISPDERTPNSQPSSVIDDESPTIADPPEPVSEEAGEVTGIDPETEKLEEGVESEPAIDDDISHEAPITQ